MAREKIAHNKTGKNGKITKKIITEKKHRDDAKVKQRESEHKTIQLKRAHSAK